MFSSLSCSNKVSLPPLDLAFPQNTSNEKVLFSVKTTAPTKYAVRPPQGVIAPGSGASVVILMSNKKAPEVFGLQKMDKFLVQYL